MRVLHKVHGKLCSYEKLCIDFGGCTKINLYFNLIFSQTLWSPLVNNIYSVEGAWRAGSKIAVFSRVAQRSGLSEKVIFEERPKRIWTGWSLQGISLKGRRQRQWSVGHHRPRGLFGVPDHLLLMQHRSLYIPSVDWFAKSEVSNKRPGLWGVIETW